MLWESLLFLSFYFLFFLMVKGAILFRCYLCIIYSKIDKQIKIVYQEVFFLNATLNSIYNSIGNTARWQTPVYKTRITYYTGWYIPMSLQWMKMCHEFQLQIITKLSQSSHLMLRKNFWILKIYLSESAKFPTVWLIFCC